MSFYALLVSGIFMLTWGSTIKNTGNFVSLIIVKVIPALLGIWCLWEAALIHLTKTL